MTQEKALWSRKLVQEKRQMEKMRFPSLEWQVLKGLWKARDREEEEETWHWRDSRGLWVKFLPILEADSPGFKSWLCHFGEVASSFQIYFLMYKIGMLKQGWGENEKQS